MKVEDIDKLPILWDFRFNLPTNKVMSTNTISQGLFETIPAKRMRLRGAFIGAKKYIQKITDDWLAENDFTPYFNKSVGEVFCVGAPRDIICDPANFIAGVEKFVTDRFVHAGLLPDDNGLVIPSIDILTLRENHTNEYTFRQVFYKLE